MRRSSLWTNILAIIAIWGSIQIFFGLLGVDSVAAATLSEYVQDKIYMYNSILNGLYLLIRPALALAGFALDNSMVYGSLFGLDAPLFLIWNIIKNIANFILGFMVLFEILKNFFTTGESGKKAFEVIKKALIAGVLIQASWFLMGAIIDVSTIATYSIGGMPIAILGGNDNQCKALGDLKMLPIGTKVDFTASNADYSIDNGFQYYYYINKPGNPPDKTYFSPCEFYNDRWVIGQKFWGTHGGIEYKDNYCIMPGNQFVYFTKQLATDTAVMQSVVGQGPVQDGNDPIGYKQNMNELLNNSGGLSNPVNRNLWQANEFIFDAWSGARSEAFSATPGIYLLNATGQAFVDVFGQAPMLKEIIDKAEGFVVVLITLYKSVLNFVSFNTGSSSTDTFILFLEALLKVGFGLAMLIPLILLSIALVIRVGYIWMFIALSPIIALKIAFDDNDTIKGLRSSIPIIREKLSDIIRIIFAPVLITFAVSFCLVFMTALITSINNQPSNNPSQCLGDSLRVYESMNVKTSNPSTTGNRTYQIAGIAEFQESAFGVNITGPQRDIFGWVLINLFGVAIVWLLLMTVIESVFKGTPVGNWNLKQTAGNMLASIPIIPIPNPSGGRTAVGAGTLSKAVEDKVADVNRSLNANNLDEILGKKKKKDETQATATTSATTNTTLQTINGLNDTETAAIIGTAAGTAGLGTEAYKDIDKIPESVKKEKAENISKTIIANNETYTAYKTKLEENYKGDALSKRIDADANWINTNKNLFNQNEFQSILQRKNDPLAKRLAPQEKRSRIQLADSKESILVFDTDKGLYSFEEPQTTDTNTKPYEPLITNPNINNWTADIKALQEIKRP